MYHADCLSVSLEAFGPLPAGKWGAEAVQLVHCCLAAWQEGPCVKAWPFSLLGYPVQPEQLLRAPPSSPPLPCTQPRQRLRRRPRHERRRQPGRAAAPRPASGAACSALVPPPLEAQSHR